MNLTLRAVTAENWPQVAALQVRSEQTAWVAPNLYSLAEAAYGLPGESDHPVITPLAIYVGQELVGFTQYRTSPTHDEFYIMRVMIDARYQGQGYGRAALEELLARFRAYPRAKEAWGIYAPDNEAARRMYEALGFQEVGLDSAGDMLVWQALNPQTESVLADWPAQNPLPELTAVKWQPAIDYIAAK